MAITLTETAVKQIKKVMQEQNISMEENVLEIGISGGGCSGFQYRLGFKNRSEVDSLNATQLTFDGLNAVVENKSLKYLEGVSIDFHDGENEKGFVFDNPSMQSCCGGGCGSGSGCSN